MNGCTPMLFRPSRRSRVWASRGAATRSECGGGEGFRAGLREAGWIDGQNLVVDERLYGDGQTEGMSTLAAELLALNPDVPSLAHPGGSITGVTGSSLVASAK